MKKLVVANWKMNPQTIKEANRLFDSVKKIASKSKRLKIVICPPFVYFSSFKFQVSSFNLGAQNCYFQSQGAYTGEISPAMLKNFGCKYVIVGHSERRRIIGETDKEINQKLKLLLAQKIKPIFCVGETTTEREEGRTFEVLRSQIEKGLDGVSKKDIRNIVVAYEPVWAIGTGNPCDPKEAVIMALFIRKVLNGLYGLSVSKNILIIYGGSVNSKNAADYLAEDQIQGLLVGGASLNPVEFSKIVNFKS